MSSRPLLNPAPQEYVLDREELGELRMRIDTLESELKHVKREAVIALLTLLGAALKDIAAGKYEIAETPQSSDGHKWEGIKQRLQPRMRDAIDVLLLQGTMKRTQLAAALQMDYSNCTKNVIGVLIRQGWIVDNNGDLSLKKL